jgi:hypothetical protein
MSHRSTVALKKIYCTKKLTETSNHVACNLPQHSKITSATFETIFATPIINHCGGDQSIVALNKNTIKNTATSNHVARNIKGIPEHSKTTFTIFENNI